MPVAIRGMDNRIVLLILNKDDFVHVAGSVKISDVSPSCLDSIHEADIVVAPVHGTIKVLKSRLGSSD